MTTPAPHEVTQLLAAISGGDSRASADLLPMVYEELRKLARSYMARENNAQTLQPTALVHEAYLRLLGGQELGWDSRGHFFGAAAMAMRRILVERARARGRIKRGGDRTRVAFTEEALKEEPPATDLLALDEALDKLQHYDARKCEVVMLRYFAGLSVDETAAAMGLSNATVRNEWTFARAWLLRQLAMEGGAVGGVGEVGGPVGS
jgi:RNA polymerase sigma factor (TIGR02999 family)